MTVEVFGPGGAGAASVEATRVVVKDQHGNPLAVVVEHETDQYWCAHQDDPDFETVLEVLGIKAANVLRRFTVQ
jgi:hypothetical protein